MYTFHFLLFAPFMLISSLFLCIQDTYSSEKGKPKRLHIVTFLSLLIILSLSLWNFLPQLSYTILLFLLAGISNTIKPFIYFLVGRCRKNCSMGSLRESLQRVFGKQKKTHRAVMMPPGTRVLSMLIPSTALMKDPRTVAEGFPESSN